ncbi:MAG: 4Fe-4S dicluster domain-containing protein, partial [Bacteroidota bacterium]
RSVRERVEDEMRESNWQAFVAAMAERRSSAAPLVVLAEPDPSPTAARLRQQVEEAFPETRWITLYPQGDDPQALGTQLAFGRPLRPLLNFTEADVVVSFDADFLGAEDSNSGQNAREYMASRRVEVRTTSGRTPMSRMYAAESAYSGTGGMADHRLAMKAGEVSLFAAAVASALGINTGAPSKDFTEEESAVLDALVADVREASGRSVFVAGAAQPPSIHALCAALNAQFGTSVVQYIDTGAEAVQPVGPQLREAVADMRAGRVGTLLMLGTNPVYTLPAELEFTEAMEAVPLTVHLGPWRDETAQRVDWHVPQAHYLESWGDGRSYDGTFTIVQPLIAPLYVDAHSTLEVLGTMLTGRDVSGYDLVRESFADRIGTAGTQSFENTWRTLLHDGFLPDSQFPVLSASGASTPDLSRLQPAEAENIELVVRLSPTLYDGRFSNNAWMQEAPDPVTKMVWDNAAVMSAATAEALGVTSGIDKQTILADTVTITGAGDATVTRPVWIQPGHPDNSITVTLGYGREIETDRVINDRHLIARLFDKDVDIYRPGPLTNGVGGAVEGLRSSNFFPVMPGVGVTKAGEGFQIVTTQDHGSMEGRDIVRMLTAEQYVEDPGFIQDQIHLIEDTPWEDFPPLWNEPNNAANDERIGKAMYSENQWGIAVDLNSCHGCNACVVACQAENNIPVVGKDQVGRGREMSWIRMDRYYVGGEETDRPGMVSMPMMCQHCENAPCEQVCPVAATVHSPDGLNAMIYNRCIGTRYCANNCPYKVRRYNFYNWTKTLPIEVQMQQNPSVTVRYRGVMEKCTMCIHRIRQVQQYAHIEDRDLSTEDIEYVSACEEACSTGALVFGDLADPDSEVNRVKRNSRNYALLAELAVRPRVTYLARLRNPNPTLVAAGYDPYHAEDDHHGGDHGADEPSTEAESLDA